MLKAERGGSLLLGPLKVSTIEVDVGCIQVDRAHAVMAGASLINDAGGIEMF